MTKFKSLFLLLVTAVLFISCDPSDNDSDSNANFTENFGNVTSKDFLGQVVDENNNPIQNVAIKIGSSTAQTDANGVFIINDASVYEKFAYITAKKAGFIDGSRAMVPTSGSNRVKIMMLSGTVVATVNSGVSSEAVLANGTKVTFDGNFKTENGTAYSGSVNIIMHHLDPADPNVADKMPGMLFAESADGQAKVLETYGMMNVELRGTGNEKLQISNTAQIEMPITATQLTSAPATIPLWHFDETLGYWKEEGSATKQGDKYVGTVSHFSWWNCDIPNSSILLTFNLVDVNGNPMSGLNIELLNSDNYHAYGTTDSNGQLSGILPANQTLTLTVYSPFACNSTLYTTSVGPFSSDTVLPNIVVANGTAQSIMVQGTLLKCDNSNVTHGYVKLQYGNQTLFSTVTNGDFSFNTLFCISSNSFTLQGSDSESFQSTGAINYIFTSPMTNVGNLVTCNLVTEFISYQIDNQPVEGLIDYLTANWNGTSLYISGLNSGQGGPGLYMYGNTIVPGAYTTAQFSIGAAAQINSSTTNTVSFHLNSFGAIGEYVDMAFNGTYNDSSGVPHTINGTVHILRDN